MIIVADASMVVAGLSDSGADGTWAEALLDTGSLAAPHLLHVEVAAILRRAALNGDLSPTAATLAHADLLDVRVELFHYEPFAHRIWELRDAVTPYDAWYVAIAEHLGAPLATLDRRLSRAPGPTCTFLVPPVPADADDHG